MLVVQVTPPHDSYVPITAAAIDRRLDQITANAALNAELAALEWARENGVTTARLHHIAAENEIDGLAQRNPADLGRGFIALLHGRGRSAADRWCAARCPRERHLPSNRNSWTRSYAFSAASRNRAPASAFGVIAVIGNDLHADRQIAAGDIGRHVDAGRAHQRPQPVEGGIAGPVQPFWRGAGCGQRQDHIDLAEGVGQHGARFCRDLARLVIFVLAGCSGCRRAGRAAAAASRHSSRDTPRRRPDVPRIAARWCGCARLPQ